MNTYRQFIILLFSVLLIGCSEDPVEDIDTGTLTGKVVEKGTNLPLENVKISTNPGSSTVFTDAEGEFVIDDILVDQYSVQAQLDGYLAAFESATITREATVNVVFELDIETANNLPPTVPVLISPEDNLTDVDINTELVWAGSDPDDDDITYLIELRNNVDDEILEFETLNDTTLVLTNLRFGLKYFWQVGAKDDINEDIIRSETRTFQTLESPENRFLFVREIDGQNVIFSSDETGNEYQLTDSDENSYRPRRNNAANKIAYISNSGAQTHIFTMNLDGSGKQQITSKVQIKGFNLDHIDFSWTDNGARLIYPNFDKLFSINNDGTGLEELYQTPDGSLISEAVISSDETIYVLKTNDLNGYNSKIYLIDTAGNEITTVLSDVPGAAGGLDISVDNSKVVYWYDVSEFESDNYRQLDSRIFIYDLSTNEADDISGQKNNGTNDYDCRFSPNEAEIIFTNTSNDGISQKDVYTINTGSGGIGSGRTLLFEDAFMPDYE